MAITKTARQGATNTKTGLTINLLHRVIELKGKTP
uniref:Uncharacterized protein n=1 Tax=Siphoviridae sp. ctwHj1 TaxID=2825727 RepID=A0A8S5U699_9CAUD|nr:MAG TPA: hypothetical protein [Siphoviridae sp. ctwHj1]